MPNCLPSGDQLLTASTFAETSSRQPYACGVVVQRDRRARFDESAHVGPALVGLDDVGRVGSEIDSLRSVFSSPKSRFTRLIVTFGYFASNSAFSWSQTLFCAQHSWSQTVRVTGPVSVTPVTAGAGGAVTRRPNRRACTRRRRDGEPDHGRSAEARPTTALRPRMCTTSRRPETARPYVGASGRVKPWYCSGFLWSCERSIMAAMSAGPRRTAVGSPAAPLRAGPEGLAHEIERGRRPVGSRLPPERALAEHFGVSRVTLRRALDELARAGMVVRRSAAAGPSRRRRSASRRTN